MRCRLQHEQLAQSLTSAFSTPYSLRLLSALEFPAQLKRANVISFNISVFPSVFILSNKENDWDLVESFFSVKQQITPSLVQYHNTTLIIMKTLGGSALWSVMLRCCLCDHIISWCFLYSPCLSMGFFLGSLLSFLKPVCGLFFLKLPLCVNECVLVAMQWTGLYSTRVFLPHVVFLGYNLG